MEVSLMDILDAREARVRLQQQFLQEYACPLVCFTMNIAGPTKTTPLIQRGFRAGLDALMAKLPTDCIRNQYVHTAATGCTAMLSVDMNAQLLKNICVALEEANTLGRLFDMDVLDLDGTKLERKTLRGCLVCGAPGRECASSRRHSVAELQAVTTDILSKHFEDADAQYIADLAVESLIEEVNTTPKPGLVDRKNNGSHKDMTLDHFYNSAEALRPYFIRCVKIGRKTGNLSAEETFPALRAAGLEAEKTMFSATRGVNTHKGAIYTLGVLCGAIGRLWTLEEPFFNPNALFEECSRIVSMWVQADFDAAKGITAGEQLYLQYGLGGIRQEVASGLPSVRHLALPCYEKALSDGCSQNDAGVITLLHLIANVADTNLYHRGGPEGAKWAAQACTALLPHPNMTDIESLDNTFIQRNLSPGGCADLLAVTYFLHKLK